MMMYRLAFVLLLSSALLGCTSTKQTLPARSATEQMLISGAADAAAKKLTLDVPADTRVWLQTSGFKDSDGQYAVGAIRQNLLEQGLRMAKSADSADVIVEVRAGALSIDERRTLFGTPSIEVPVPFATSPELPELPLFKKEQQEGVAKIAAFAYDTDDGSLIAHTDPTFGFSNLTRWRVLLFVSWTTSDLIPDGARD